MITWLHSEDPPSRVLAFSETATTPVPCATRLSDNFEMSNKFTNELHATAKAMVADGKGAEK
jgi:hypothetical protein